MSKRLHRGAAGGALLMAAMLQHSYEAIARETIRECAIPVQSILVDELPRGQRLSLEMLPRGPVLPNGGPGVSVRGLGTLGSGGSVQSAGDGVPLSLIERIEVVSGPDGIPCRTVPDEQWTARGAFDGRTLVLPSNGFGALFGQDAVSGAARIRQTFGVRDGQILSGRDWAFHVAAPFGLLCRSDEGAPQSLSSGERFSYDVPGDESGLQFVIGQPFVVEPSWYRLPEGGYAVSSASGVVPKETWRGLNDLALAGRIRNLEIDPCWKFLPEGAPAAQGCAPGPGRFPDKSVRYSSGFGGTLSDPFIKSPLGNSWVRWGPLSPTPFFDPGERSGDDRPPTYTMTGLGGMYRANLDGLTGPFEIDVANGCDSHATVAISDGPSPAGGPAAAPEGASQPRAGSTTARASGDGATTRSPGPSGPGATDPPRGDPEKLATRRKPEPNERICGPDVTDHVFKVLKAIRETYESWTPEVRTARCDNLYHWRQFNAAWDMQGFAPSDAGDSEVPGTPGYIEFPFFSAAAPGYCGVPRHPCGATVEFLGHCIHAQVVNYVQWGAMNELCDTEVKARFAISVRSFFSPNAVGQEAMLNSGEDYDAFRNLDPATRKNLMKKLLDKRVGDAGSDWGKMAGTDCALRCAELAPEAAQFLENFWFGFQWGFGKEPIKIMPKHYEEELRRSRERRQQQQGQAPK